MGAGTMALRNAIEGCKYTRLRKIARLHRWDRVRPWGSWRLSVRVLLFLMHVLLAFSLLPQRCGPGSGGAVLLLRFHRHSYEGVRDDAAEEPT